MKQKVKRTFYANRQIYVIGDMYETDQFDADLVKDYFEEVEKPKRTTKKKVRKPKPRTEKIETKKEQKDNPPPEEADKNVESVEEPVVTKED